MSLNCVDASIELADQYNVPIILIASRRQIDSESFGGGYVNNWSTEKFSGIAPYFNEHVRKELEKIDSELGINIYRDGLKIHTTIDPKIQKNVHPQKGNN